ncbi:MAG: prolyl oligopeptidase family serine peptidase [Candidatus Aminicenantes bacterium]|nr:prolyl oligopeptidase family serine peptidase [Candidatus Aminicenantes bacterium]
MRKHPTILKWTLALAILVLLPLTDAAGQAAGKKPITYEAYNGWRSIQGAQLSRDGAWLAYALTPQDGDGELVVRGLKTDKEYRAGRGSAPVITVDGKFVVFTVLPLKDEVEKAKKEKKKPEEQPKNALGIMNLAGGEIITVERVKSYKMAEESGAFVAYLLEPPLKKPEEKAVDKKETAEKKEPAAKVEPEKKAPAAPAAEKKEEATEAKKKKEKKHEPGTDLVVRELATGKSVTINEVTEYVWNKPGTWLAYAVMSKKPEDDGAFVRKAADGMTIALLKGQGNAKGFAFEEKGAQLAFMSDRDEWKNDVGLFKLYHWAEPAVAAGAVASGAAKGMPQGMVVGENGALNFSKDGTKLFFGYAAPPKPEPAEDAPEPTKVDIWSWTDADLQPMQKVNADQEKKRSYRAVIHLKEKKIVALATPDMPTITLSDDAKLVLGSSDVPYRKLVSWEQGYDDYYLVNIMDGSRKKILEKCGNAVSISPGGNFLLYYADQDRSWYSFRILDGKTSNLTAKLGVNFFREEADTPSEPAPYGSGGWTEGDKTVLLYDRYDIWEVKPDGSGGRTATDGRGRKNELVFRTMRLDRDEKTVPTKTPILLSTSDEKTKASGYYKVTLAGPADPAKVVMLDKRFGSLQKAKNAETYIFTLSRFEEFPNLWLSGPDLAEMRKVSDANPQQAQYVWGRSELIHYLNADGVTLDAVLTKPEDFDPSKKYPLMVYIYEKLAQGLHNYAAPGPGTSINPARYVSNGYILLQPDIVYEIGYPGSSAMKCVLPAIQKVVSEGTIDPKRIGIQGHSWGGYQITYMVTQTDIFAAVQAGASVSNMTSAYGGIRWGSGMVREFQYEKTQSRIGATLFSRALQFIENSPVFWAERVRTPYLTIHNDDDDAVPWYQGIEFFTALRRLGKEAYMFVYNGEKHGLRERENQKHWTVHMDEFFDHFLLGKPKPEWMEKGVPYLEKGKRDVNPMFKKEMKK